MFWSYPNIFNLYNSTVIYFLYEIVSPCEPLVGTGEETFEQQKLKPMKYLSHLHSSKTAESEVTIVQTSSLNIGDSPPDGMRNLRSNNGIVIFLEDNVKTQGKNLVPLWQYFFAEFRLLDRYFGLFRFLAICLVHLMMQTYVWGYPDTCAISFSANLSQTGITKRLRIYEHKRSFVQHGNSGQTKT